MERLSLIVTIAGIPLLLVSIRALVRRPNLTVGFVPSSTVGILRWRRRKPLANFDAKLTSMNEAVTLPVVIVNNGRASAREVLANFRFPAELHVTVGGLPEYSHVEFHPELKLWVWVLERATIHPDDDFIASAVLTAPAGLSGFDIDVEMSMANAARVKAKLRVELGRAGAAP